MTQTDPNRFAIPGMSQRYIWLNIVDETLVLDRWYFENEVRVPVGPYDTLDKAKFDAKLYYLTLEKKGGATWAPLLF